MKIILTTLVILILCGCTTNKPSSSIYTSLPDTIDSDKKYLFFLHGKIVEKKGLPAISKTYGEYEYEDILETFSLNEFIVISEVRGKDTDIYNYAYKISEQVEQLIKSGVSPSNITVSGFSKGGRITLVVSSLLNNKNIHYVILAGCRTSDIDAYNLSPTGKVLSIYDASDIKFGTCLDIFAKSDNSLYSQEIVLETGDGHGVFYQPEAKWVTLITEWASK